MQLPLILNTSIAESQYTSRELFGFESKSLDVMPVRGDLMQKRFIYLWQWSFATWEVPRIEMQCLEHWSKIMAFTSLYSIQEAPFSLGRLHEDKIKSSRDPPLGQIFKQWKNLLVMSTLDMTVENCGFRADLIIDLVDFSSRRRSFLQCCKKDTPSRTKSFSAVIISSNCMRLVIIPSPIWLKQSLCWYYRSNPTRQIIAN